MSPVQPPLPAVPPPTRQLPVLPPPGGSGSTALGAHPGGAAGAVPTGPVDWMPLPPEPGAVPPSPRPAPEPVREGFFEGAEPAPTDAPARRRVRLRLPEVKRPAHGGRGTAAAVLGLVALLLLELGLLVHQAGTTLWGRVPLWSSFATVAAVVGLAAVLGSRAAAPVRDRAWAVGAGGLTGVAVFWLLVVLPTADTDRGFVLTAALACLGGSLWLTAGARRDARPAGDGAPEVPEAGSAAPSDDATAGDAPAGDAPADDALPADEAPLPDDARPADAGTLPPVPATAGSTAGPSAG